MNQVHEYRQQLLSLEEKAQATFDKTVVTLSGGALGISFAFTNSIVGTSPVVDRPWLIAAWGAWVGSLAASLSSHYFSTFAIRRRIETLDSGAAKDGAGRWDRAVVVTNAASAVLFLAGAAAIGVFVVNNLK